MIGLGIKYYDKKLGIDMFSEVEYSKFIQKCKACDVDIPKALAPVMVRLARQVNELYGSITARIIHKLTGLDVEWDMTFGDIAADEKEMAARLLKREDEYNKNCEKMYNGRCDFDYFNDFYHVWSDLERHSMETHNRKRTKKTEKDEHGSIACSLDDIGWEQQPLEYIYNIKLHIKGESGIQLKIHDTQSFGIREEGSKYNVVNRTLGILYWLAHIANRFTAEYEHAWLSKDRSTEGKDWLREAGFYWGDADNDDDDDDDDDVDSWRYGGVIRSKDWDRVVRSYTEYKAENGEDEDELMDILTTAFERGSLSNIYQAGYDAHGLRQSACTYAAIVTKMYFNLTSEKLQSILSTAYRYNIESCNILRDTINNYDFSDSIARDINGIDEYFTVYSDYATKMKEYHDLMIKTWLNTLWVVALNLNEKAEEERKSMEAAREAARESAIDKVMAEKEARDRVEKAKEIKRLCLEKMENDAEYWLENFNLQTKLKEHSGKSDEVMSEFIAKCNEAGLDKETQMVEAMTSEFMKLFMGESAICNANNGKEVTYTGLMLELSSVGCAIVKLTDIIRDCAAGEYKESDKVTNKVRIWLRAVGEDSEVNKSIKNALGMKIAEDEALRKIVRPCVSELVRQVINDKDGELTNFNEFDRYTWSENEHKYIASNNKKELSVGYGANSDYCIEAEDISIDAFDGTRGILAWDMAGGHKIEAELVINVETENMYRLSGLMGETDTYADGRTRIASSPDILYIVNRIVPMMIDIHSIGTRANNKERAEAHVLRQLHEFMQVVNVARECIVLKKSETYLEVSFETVKEYIKESACKDYYCTWSDDGIRAAYDVAYIMWTDDNCKWFMWELGENVKAHTLEQDLAEAKRLNNTKSAEILEVILDAQKKLKSKKEYILDEFNSNK